MERFPEGRFIYIDRNGETSECSFRETLAQASRLLAGLRRQGVRTGDPLLIGLTNARDVVPALWAAAMAGCVAIPSVQPTGADNTSILDAKRLAFLNEIFGRIHVLTDTATAGPQGILLHFEELIATPATLDLKLAAGEAEELRFCILTSGTTARPRLVGLSDRAALARWWPK
ncbi:MAG: AMP-binding protein, partial [Rhizobiaceae bacterium]